jgi:hypothetical protein
MRRALTTTLLLALCFSAAAQERTKTQPPQTGEAATAEAVRSLVSLLKKARGITIPRTQTTQRLSRVRAEGCVLRYDIVTEYESPNYHSWDRPQVLDSSYRLTEREFVVNLSDLDAARVRMRVENRSKKKSGGHVIFATSGGRESVRERGLRPSRVGTRYTTSWWKNASLPVGDDGSLETIAGALRRAVEACGAGPAKTIP